MVRLGHTDQISCKPVRYTPTNHKYAKEDTLHVSSVSMACGRRHSVRLHCLGQTRRQVGGESTPLMAKSIKSRLLGDKSIAQPSGADSMAGEGKINAVNGQKHQISPPWRQVYSSTVWGRLDGRRGKTNAVNGQKHQISPPWRQIYSSTIDAT